MADFVINTTTQVMGAVRIGFYRGGDDNLPDPALDRIDHEETLTTLYHYLPSKTLSYLAPNLAAASAYTKKLDGWTIFLALRAIARKWAAEPTDEGWVELTKRDPWVAQTRRLVMMYLLDKSILRPTLEEVYTSYVEEAEHQDGYDYWHRFFFDPDTSTVNFGGVEMDTLFVRLLTTEIDVENPFYFARMSAIRDLYTALLPKERKWAATWVKDIEDSSGLDFWYHELEKFPNPEEKRAAVTNWFREWNTNRNDEYYPNGPTATLHDLLEKPPGPVADMYTPSYRK